MAFKSTRYRPKFERKERESYDDRNQIKIIKRGPGTAAKTKSPKMR